MLLAILIIASNALAERFVPQEGEVWTQDHMISVQRMNAIADAVTIAICGEDTRPYHERAEFWDTTTFDTCWHLVPRFVTQELELGACFVPVDDDGGRAHCMVGVVLNDGDIMEGLPLTELNKPVYVHDDQRLVVSDASPSDTAPVPEPASTDQDQAPRSPARDDSKACLETIEGDDPREFVRYCMDMTSGRESREVLSVVSH